MSDKNEKKNSSIWLPMIMFAALTTGGNYYFLSKYAAPEVSNAADEATAQAGDPHFLVVEPFTVNVISEGHRSRLLYSGISLSTPDAASLEVLQKHMPQVKNRLISVISSSHADELMTTEGKDKLAQRILDGLKDPTLIPQRGLVINEVLFTDFVVQ